MPNQVTCLWNFGIATQPHIFVQKSTTSKNTKDNQETNKTSSFSRTMNKGNWVPLNKPKHHQSLQNYSATDTSPHTANWGLRIKCSPVQVDKELALDWRFNNWWWSRVFILVFIQSSFSTCHTNTDTQHAVTLRGGSTVPDISCFEYMLTYFTMSWARLRAKPQVWCMFLSLIDCRMHVIENCHHSLALKE